MTGIRLKTAISHLESKTNRSFHFGFATRYRCSGTISVATRGRRRCSPNGCGGASNDDRYGMGRQGGSPAGTGAAPDLTDEPPIRAWLGRVKITRACFKHSRSANAPLRVGRMLNMLVRR